MTVKSGRASLHQRKNVRPFWGIIEGTEFCGFLQPPHPVESIQILRVTGGELARFQITATQILIAKSVRTLPGKKMEAQPAAIGAGNALGLAKEGNEQKQNEVSIDLCLQLEI